MKFLFRASLLAAFAASALHAQPEPRADAPTRLADLAIEAEAERPAAIATEHFAARSAYRDFAMSPDGRHLAIRRVHEGRNDILLLDAATQDALKLYKLGDDQRIDWFRWAGNDKLIFSISMRGKFYDIPVRVNRLFVRNIATDETWMLDVPGDLLWGGDLIHVDDDGAFALVSVQRGIRSDPSVYRYQLVPGAERERVVKPKSGVWNWYADDAGTVRMGIGYRGKRMRIYYRDTADDDFELVDKLRRGDDRVRYWHVVQIRSGSDRGYVLEEDENERVGVRLFDYSTGETLETFYQHPDWDVNELWLDREGNPLAALYTDDRDRIEWFDEEMGVLFERLRDAVGLDQLRIVTRSRDNDRMLIWGGSESDPGALYIFSPGERRLDLLDNYRPEVDFTALARPRPVRYRARDGLMITAYLTLPRGVEPSALPLVIMPHGGPFGIRDKLEYNDEVQLLANRGYAVLQPNYRGSGGYGQAFAEAGHGEVGRAMQDDIDDAMAWAVAEGLADPARVCVVGGSYGGFAALWAVLRNPERYACAASWAGVTDWDRMLSYDRRYLGREQARDLRRREEGEDADLDEFSPVNLAQTLSRPVLLAHGTSDRRVPVSQYHAFDRATRDAPVRPVTLLIEGEGHGFTKAANEQKWYDALVAFLAEHNPADPPPVDATAAP
ncbi:alpha/beta hydrolase family protein [Qipengyuania nanhaisediminis]|uniref:alpha/beta hydrolase family protein n=1 Tax=Qipengyuania nanhaisediminis TaxID=604088 RepID=UPI0038B3627F